MEAVVEGAMAGIAACVPVTGMRLVGSAVADIGMKDRRPLLRAWVHVLSKRQSCLHRKTACCVSFTLQRLYLAPKLKELVITAFSFVSKT